MAVRELLKQMLGMVALTGATWLAVLYARVLGSLSLILIWSAFSGVMAVGLWRHARRRRRVWLHAYLRSDSGWVTRLRGGLLMGLWQAVLALCLSAFLLVLLVRNSQPWLWAMLLLTGLLLPLCTHLLSRQFQGQVQSVYVSELALQCATTALALLLWGAVVWHALGVSYPDFRQASLEQAVWYTVSSQHARSDLLRILLELGAAADGLTQWLAQRLMPAPAQSAWQALGWMLLLARDALFVWSYLLLCRGALVVLSRTPTTRMTEEEVVDVHP